jgi:dTDP-4-dehydrorhamnose 3,5-epimerase
MKLTETPLAGAYIIEPEPVEDHRGWFARVFDRDTFAALGLCTDFPQHSLSFNIALGTLRGMHYQAEPHAEAKIVRCTAGAIHDVIVDLRQRSATFHRTFAVELSAANHRAVYVPHGCAHGYLTLTADTEVSYLISEPYVPELARGVRWNDPLFGIVWPFEPKVLSERDAGFPDSKSSPHR